MPAKILDDPDQIRRVDRSNMLSFCIDASKHFRKAAELAEAVSTDYSKPETMIVAGAGGSAIGGELLKDWATDRIAVPVEVCREYSLPAYANENTLVFAISYSGETEETLGMFLDAIRRKCMTFCIGSGGKLLQFAEKLDFPSFHAPSGIPPRAALPYLFVPMLVTLEKLGVISDVNPEIDEATQVLEQVALENNPEIRLEDNLSKSLASKIRETIPVTYGFRIYRAVAQRYKQQFNENSKVPAEWNYLPELNHNEIMGLEAKKGLLDYFSTIFIRDEREPAEMKHRIEATKDLMLQRTKNILEVWSVGERKLARMASSIYIGDFASVYLAVLRGVDPTPVKTIAVLKKRISGNGVKDKISCELQRLCEK